jgi:anti-repressor protein
MSNIVPYNFDGISIRAMEIDGEPYFVGNDVAEALGYVNASDAITTHCKGVAKRYPLQTAGGKQEVRVISETDMLRLIVSSALPAADRFECSVFETAFKFPCVYPRRIFLFELPSSLDPSSADLECQ